MARIDTVRLAGSTIQTAGWRFNSVRAEAGIVITDAVSICTRPVTVAPSRIASGGSVRPTFTSKVLVTGSACGPTSRTRPVAVTEGSSVRRTVDRRIARRCAQHLGGHVEHRVPPALVGNLHDHLSGLHHLARARRPAPLPCRPCPPAAGCR